MNNKRHFGKVLMLLTALFIWVCSMSVSAGELSDDNSLSSLGITTEGAVVSPEFAYNIIEYNVSVPSDIKEITLNPVTSNENATIVDISGTQIVDGKTTVVITVAAENGNQYAYYLYVTADGAPIGVPEPETEPQTEKKKVTKEKETEPETEPETEDPRYVKVDRNSLQEAENTITALKNETSSYREKVALLTKILYGMIAFAVLLLFIVINLLLKKKDLKAEVMAYRSAGFTPESVDDYANGQDYNGAYGYDDQGYYDQGYGDQQYYDPYQEQQPVYEEPAKKNKKAKKAKKGKNDANAVQAPEAPVEQMQQQYQNYQQPVQNDAKKNDIEVTMIDL